MLPTTTPLHPPLTVLWVALGGALGAALRFMVGEGARRWPALAAFPWTTLAVNVAGSLALGFILRWATTHEASPQARAFLMVGVCGGFTTFSAFALEAAGMLQHAQVLRAALYATGSVLLCVGAVFLGFALHGPT
jgi:CrcB protein